MMDGSTAPRIDAKSPWSRVAFLLLPLVVACEGGGTPLERSCNGKAIPNCLPEEYSIVEEATVEPPGVEVDNPDETLQVRVRLATCGEEAPRPHEVSVRARTDAPGTLPDAGDEPRETVFDVLTLRDDGMTAGDAVARDGEIDVEVENPFIGPEVLANRELILRFEPRAPAQCGDDGCIGGTCRGEPLEIPYRTGPRFTP